MRFFLPILLLCLSTFLSAQGSVHFERPFHVAGEVAWFAVHLAEAQPPGKVKVEVFSPAGERQDYFFLDGTDGSLSGYYRWPFTNPTGYYRLRFSALAADGATVDLGTVRQPVYADKRVEASAPARPAAALPSEAGDLQLTATPERLTLSGLGGASYSVAVVQDEVIPNARGAVRTLSGGTGGAGRTFVDTLFYQGRIGLADGEPLATNLLPFFDPLTYTFGFSKSDAAGAFDFRTDAFYGSKTVYVRDVDDRNVQPRPARPTLPALTDTPPVTAGVAAYVDLARRRRKIYQLYATVETELNITPTLQERRELRPNRSFQVQDYKRFPNMYNFFKEVAGELRVRQRKDNYTAKLYNAPNQRYFTGSPLYLIDGRPTRDDNFVMNLDPADVRYLAYFYDNRQLRRDFPALGNAGVVQIETVRGLPDFSAAEKDDGLELRGLLPPVEFPTRDATVGEVPALSPVLLWRAGAGQDEVALDLPASDDAGTYRVIVAARGADGRLRTATATFERAVR